MDVLVAHLRHQRLLTDFLYVSAAAVMVWDYLLTLDLEVKFVWHAYAQWNYTKVLFLITRYTPFFQSLLFLYNQVWLDVSPETCYHTYLAATWLIVLSMNIAEIALSIRTWAIWKRNTLVGVILFVTILVGLITQLFAMIRFNNSLVFSTPPYPGYRGCFIVGTSGVLIWNYIILIIIEAVVLLLMVANVFRAYRSNESCKMLHIIHRDGILFYAYILCVSLANVLIIKYTSPDLIGLLSPFEGVIYSALTCRIIFNIYRTVENPMNVDLHTENPRAEEYSVALSTVVYAETDHWC